MFQNVLKRYSRLDIYEGNSGSKVIFQSLKKLRKKKKKKKGKEKGKRR